MASTTACFSHKKIKLLSKHSPVWALVQVYHLIMVRIMEEVCVVSNFRVIKSATTLVAKYSNKGIMPKKGWLIRATQAYRLRITMTPALIVLSIIRTQRTNNRSKRKAAAFLEEIKTKEKMHMTPVINLNLLKLTGLG